MTDTTAAPTAALAAEATATNVAFVWRDLPVEIADPDTWDALEVLEAYEDGKAIRVLRAILTPATWQALRARKPGLSDLQEFVQAAVAAGGLGN